jgi:hypothetical protein
MNGGTDFGNGHGLSDFAIMKLGLTHGFAFSGFRLRRVRATALARAAGVFARTAPD